MNDLTPPEQRIAAHLQRASQTVDIGDTAVATVIRRGRQRNERRRAAVGVAAVATLSGATIGSIQLLSKPATRKVVPSTDSDLSEATTPAMSVPTTTTAGADEGLTLANRIESQLVWNSVDPGTDEALGMTVYWNPSTPAANPPFLVWSSAPGKPPVDDGTLQPTLYRSDDGIHWTPTDGTEFVEPEVSMRGLSARDGRLFAFGTAAATAPIPQGKAGDVVVDVSDDQGASWRHIVLPMDLRSLADKAGVQSIYFQGGMAANDEGVVAVAIPAIAFEPSLDARFPEGYVPQRDGVAPVHYPQCVPSDGAVPTSTMVGTGYTAPVQTQPVATAVAATTTAVGVPREEALNSCADQAPTLGDAIPWSDLGVDPQTAALMFRPRVFVSTDGEHFTEGSFPDLPDEFARAQLTVSATEAGFFVAVQNWSGVGSPLARIYSSADGLTWAATDLPSGLYDAIDVTSDGTVVAFNSGFPVPVVTDPYVAVSEDGTTWTKISLSSLLDPDDGPSARLNVYLASSGPGGVTAFATISNGNGAVSKSVVLHTADGINWSRDDVESITGRSGLAATRIQVTDNSVLVSVVDPATRDEHDIAQTSVLVGTPVS